MNQLTFRKLQATCEEVMSILDTILGYEEVGKLLEYLRCDASFDLVLILQNDGSLKPVIDLVRELGS